MAKVKAAKPVVKAPAHVAAKANAGYTPTEVEGFLVEVNDKYGAGTVVPLSRQPSILRLPTGVFDLDVALGGGFPIGRFSLVWGKRSSGKTTLTAFAIREGQRLCRHCGLPFSACTHPVEAYYLDPKGATVGEADAVSYVDIVQEDMTTLRKPQLKEGYRAGVWREPFRVMFVNQEGTLDIGWMRTLGVDIDGVLVLNTDTAEQSIDIIDSALRKKLVDLVVIDSIAALTPSVETEESAEKSQQGAQARLMNKAFRVWVSSLQAYRAAAVRPTILLVNQERTKIGVMYGDPATKPGGGGQDFVTAVEVKLSPGSVEKTTDLAAEEEGGHKLVSRTNFKVVKNKTHPDGGVGQYIMGCAASDTARPGEIVQTKAIIETAKQYGILVKDGSKWRLGDMEFPTLTAVAKWATDAPDEWRDFVRDLVSFLVKARAGV